MVIEYIYIFDQLLRFEIWNLKLAELNKNISDDVIDTLLNSRLNRPIIIDVHFSTYVSTGAHKLFLRARVRSSCSP